MSDELSTDKRIELVRIAIQRIRSAHEVWLDSQRNAASTGTERSLKKNQFDSAEKEFSWQWRNVEAIFEEKGL